jgi:hypothetical protein
MARWRESHTKETTIYRFELRVITSGRQSITVSKDGESNRVNVKGIDPDVSYNAEAAKELAALFAGVEKMLTD